MKRLGLWQIIGFAVTALGGTLLHFLYDWLGEAVWASPFSGVNESTWEHMKLLYWPMLVFAIVQSFFYKKQKDYWCVKLRGVLLGLTLIPVLFYTYNGVIGKSPDWVNITIFFISALLAYAYETRLFNSEKVKCSSEKRAMIALFAIGILFVIFTFSAPELEIFRDPISGTYGI